MRGPVRARVACSCSWLDDLHPVERTSAVADAFAGSLRDDHSPAGLPRVQSQDERPYVAACAIPVSWVEVSMATIDFDGVPAG
jgi:hypothetical protein